jgi:tetratricopeptide (TPR) repeat protein
MEENNTRPTTTTLLVWLDANIDEVKNKDSINTVSKLREVISTVHTFTNVDECIDFISDLNEERAFMISSGAFGPTTVPIVQELSQVCAIYIFCGNKTHHEQWAKHWPIIKGVFTDIKPICEALQMAIQGCNGDNISVSIVATNDDTPNKNLDQLDSSFMYTQILKEILLTINFEPKHIKQFTTYCREQFAGNTTELKNIDKFEQEYRPDTAVWWYTHTSSFYSMLNRALRTIDVDMIIKLGFFLCDLHRQIAQLHDEQYGGHNHSNSFIVYRGQGMSQTDFNQLAKTKGGLLSFNNFLSSNKNREVSLAFASANMESTELIGVLFMMTIDPSKSSTPFADINGLSYFQEEEEVLFSMHSVFRIEEVKQLDGNNRLWQVDLSLTSDRDQDLECLTGRIREETFPDAQGWYRLGQLLIKMGHFDKAQQVFNVLLDETTDDSEKASIYHQLGIFKINQGQYAEAIVDFEKSMEISKNSLAPNHPDLAHSYNNIAVVYDKMGDYSKALSYHEKALGIRQQTLPPNHPDLATSYTNIGMVYNNMSDHSKALSSHEKAIDIRQKTLPPNHPDLATSYNNIATVYYQMNDYSKALSFYQRALHIGQQSLPADHPHVQLYKMNVELVQKKL